jgi:anti-sigma factor RsiW
MKCKELAEFLFDYVSNDLPAERREHFEFHLKKCGNCHEYLVQYEMVIKAGRIACGDASDELPKNIPDDLVKAVLAARKI